MLPIKLSSKWTKTSLYLGIIVPLLLLPSMFLISVFQEEFKGLIFGFFINIALIAVGFYLFTYGCIATIYGETIVVKKMNKPEETISISNIHSIKVMNFKSTKYTTLHLKNNSKYIILNSRSIFDSNRIDPREILLEIQKDIKIRMKSDKQ